MTNKHNDDGRLFKSMERGPQAKDDGAAAGNLSIADQIARYNDKYLQGNRTI